MKHRIRARCRGQLQSLVVACANLVLVYHVKEDDLVHRLKGHKADVYSVTA
jgi:hypothetical protein